MSPARTSKFSNTCGSPASCTNGHHVVIDAVRMCCKTVHPTMCKKPQTLSPIIEPTIKQRAGRAILLILPCTEKTICIARCHYYYFFFYVFPFELLDSVQVHSAVKAPDGHHCLSHLGQPVSPESVSIVRCTESLKKHENNNLPQHRRLLFLLFLTY